MDKILVTRSSLPPLEDYINYLKPLWENHWLTNAGMLHEELASRLAASYFDAPTALFANGHLALEIALQALDLKGSVITTPFTFISTTNAILRNGLCPVFCDIDPVTWTMDPEALEALITPDTCAILPVHVYGVPCHIEEIEAIARKHDLKVIYDAAHTFGARLKGESFARFGDASMFSFHATKVFHTAEGGALSFRNMAHYEKALLLRDFGLYNSGTDALYAGTNAKLSELHAAMGLCNLDRLPGETRKRRRASDRYDSRLKGIKGLLLFPDIPDLERNYAYYPVLFTEEFIKSREEVASALEKKQIFPRRYFSPLTSEMTSLREWEKIRKQKKSGRESPQVSTPVAEYVSRRILCLPLFAGLEDSIIDSICDTILE